MVDYETRLNEILALGCSFEDDQKFKDFLDTIEKLEGKEINYYHTLKSILRRIVYHNAGTPVDHTKKDGIKSSFSLAPGGMNIKVIFKKENSEDSTSSKLYNILDIVIYENATLKEWGNKRY